MNTSLTKFCRDRDLPKSSVYRRCQELKLETADGLTPEACERLLHEFGVVTTPPETESEKLPEAEPAAVTVEIGNHQLVLTAPALPQTYLLETLRTDEALQFEDPLAIAAQFLVIADQVQAAMDADIEQREQKLAVTR